jgi:hypothetical protein
VLRILDGWFEAYMPVPALPDELLEKIMVDEVLPPVLLLMVSASNGSPRFAQVFKEHLFPYDL